MTEPALASPRPAAGEAPTPGLPAAGVVVFVMVAVGNGRVGIEWGVYGVPETFVISQDGVIAHKHVGQVSAKDLAETILPIVEKLRR